MTDFFPIGELIDRYCIAKLKLERTEKNQVEFEFYQTRISSIDTVQIKQQIENLYNVHNEIWNLESSLKSGLEDCIPLEEIGRRAIQIRDWNRKRVVIKNEIADILSDPVREIKHNHLSE